MTEERAQVIVVGAGPAGAATGFHLARQGIDVLILDRARFPRDKPCSEYMSPQASRLLADMGALADVQRAGAATLGGMLVRAPNGTTFHGRYADVVGFRGYYDHGLALRRTVLDPLLLARARDVGARVREGVRVVTPTVGASGRVSGVEVIDERGVRRVLSATVVVGADGLRSIVSRRLGLASTRRAQRRVAFVSHFAGVDGMTDNGEMHVARDGYLGLADVGHGLTNVAVVVPVSQAKAASGDPTAFMDDWIRRRPHVLPRFARARRVGTVLTTGPFASAAIRAWAPGAALVGDAADFFDPFTGEGIYAALRGAELLAPRIAESLSAHRPRDADVSLADYDRARVDEFSGKWKVEQIIGAAVSFPPLMNIGARSLALRPAMAHTIVGVAGDFVPAREVLRPGFLVRLALPWAFGRARTAAVVPAPKST
ncbi:MAG TPA: FAD-dependent monooxygenase [Gemmatimonadaceae bacterium]|jgi:flavin-dependent dehydrogenase|nr:FAD-dependent monooxygenase [Gemmatimonadaceae bacterium]